MLMIREPWEQRERVYWKERKMKDRNQEATSCKLWAKRKNLQVHWVGRWTETQGENQRVMGSWELRKEKGFQEAWSPGSVEARRIKEEKAMTLSNVGPVLDMTAVDLVTWDLAWAHHNLFPGTYKYLVWLNLGAVTLQEQGYYPLTLRTGWKPWTISLEKVTSTRHQQTLHLISGHQGPKEARPPEKKPTHPNFRARGSMSSFLFFSKLRLTQKVENVCVLFFTRNHDLLMRFWVPCRPDQQLQIISLINWGAFQKGRGQSLSPKLSFHQSGL